MLTIVLFNLVSLKLIVSPFVKEINGLEEVILNFPKNHVAETLNAPKGMFAVIVDVPSL